MIFWYTIIECNPWCSVLMQSNHSSSWQKKLYEALHVNETTGYTPVTVRIISIIIIVSVVSIVA